VASNEKTAYVQGARAVMAFSVVDRLAELHAPTLVVVGEHDRVTPAVLSEVLVSRIAGARLVRISDAGHICVMEQPAAFNRILLEFLDSF
jgi:pimeloyl-ACP methyl ester carboxylesterase